MSDADAHTATGPVFLTELVMSPDRRKGDFSHWDGKTFRLVTALRYRDSEGNEHEVPAGVVFNGASTDPKTRWKMFNRFIQWLACLFIWPMDKHAEATAFHDHVYTDSTICMTREDADELFRQFLILCGVSNWKARGMYIFVRKLGASRWRERSYVF